MSVETKKKQYIDYDPNLKGLRMTREYERMKVRNEFYTNELKSLEFDDTELKKRLEELKVVDSKRLSKMEYNELKKLNNKFYSNQNYKMYLSKQIKNTT